MVRSSVASTHGFADPYSKRSAISLLIVTRPEMPFTIRITWDVADRSGMKSISSTDPLAVSKRVTKINVLLTVASRDAGAAGRPDAPKAMSPVTK